MKQVKDYIHVCYFITFLIFKSTRAAEPVAVTTWTGTLSSPNFPHTYPANSSLTWIKSVSSGNRIQISIDLLQTQCDGDYLEIRDGDSMSSPLIARYCGIIGSRQVVTSSGTHMLLHFVSDNVTESSNRGFTLRHTGVCTVHTNATSGVITPPNYPEKYPNYMDCLWTIQLHPAMLITLECHKVALEYKEGCVFDYIEILAGVSPSSPVLGRYCGVYNNSLTFERDGNMSIKFVSDKDKEFHGFRCEYNIYKVRGYWTEWTNWTECSQTCRHGNQTRYRACVNPLPASGLELLCGNVTGTETKSCLVSNCTSVDGGYTNWSNWSACHVTCGTGLRNRSRNCTNPPPAFAGKNCSAIGEPWETAECVLAPCPGVTSVVSISSYSSSTYYQETPLTSQPVVKSSLSYSSALPSSSQYLVKSSSSFFNAIQSSNYSDAMSISNDSPITPSSMYFNVTSSLNPHSSTIPSSRNVSFSSNTTAHKKTIYDTAIHGSTQTYYTLDTLEILNNSILGKRTISPETITNGELVTNTRDLKVSTLNQKLAILHSSTPGSAFSESAQVNGELTRDSAYTSGQTRHQMFSTSNTYIHSGSLVLRTTLQLNYSQTSHAIKGTNSHANVDGLSIQASASFTSSFSVATLLSQVRLSSLETSQISPNKTSNFTNLSKVDSISQANNSVVIKMVQSSIMNTSYVSFHSVGNQTGFASNFSKGSIKGSSNYYVSGTEASDLIAHNINHSFALTQVSNHSVSNGRTATIGISKSGIGFNTTETVSSEDGQLHANISTSLLMNASENIAFNSAWKIHQNRTSQESSLWTTYNNGTISQESSSEKNQRNTISLRRDPSIWMSQGNATSSKESSIWRNHPSGTSLESSTLKTHNESGTVLQVSSDYHFHSHSSSNRTFSTARNTVRLFSSIDGHSFNFTSTNYLQKTSFQPSSALLPINYNVTELTNILTANSLVSTKLDQHRQQSDYSSSLFMESTVFRKHSSSPATTQTSRTLTGDTISTSATEYTPGSSSHTIDSTLRGNQSSFLSTAQNALHITRDTTLSSATENTPGSSTHTMYSLATTVGTLHGKQSSILSTGQTGVLHLTRDTILTTDTQNTSGSSSQTIYSHVSTLHGKQTPILSTAERALHLTRDSIYSNSDGFKIASVQTMVFPQSTGAVFVSSSGDRTTTSVEGTDDSISNDLYSLPTVYTVLSTQMVIRGSIDTHQQHLGSVSTMHATATQSTHASCVSSSAVWPHDSDMHHTQEESARDSSDTLQNESLGTVKETKGQPKLSSFQARTTLSSPSSVISPFSAAPSQPPGDSLTPPALRFPWHLTPFLAIIFLIIVVLITYYLRIPDIVDAIILAIKEKRKQTRASKLDRDLDITKGNFSTAGFKASAFHSYQRELFYDETLNYALFETGTKAIEFSIHLEEEEQCSGSEESVEISCVMEEESADKKQGYDSLSELFDTSGREVVSSSAEKNRTIYLHDLPASYDI